MLSQCVTTILIWIYRKCCCYVNEYKIHIYSSDLGFLEYFSYYFNEQNVRVYASVLDLQVSIAALSKTEHYLNKELFITALVVLMSKNYLNNDLFINAIVVLMSKNYMNMRLSGFVEY